MLKEIMNKIRNLFTPVKRKNMYAVYEDDLETFLQSIGLKQKVMNGEENCGFCGSKVEYQDFQAIFKIKDEYKIVCSKQTCIDSMTNK